MLPLLITAASLVPSIEELMLNQASVLPTEVSSVQMARAGANSHNKRITRARIRGFPPRRRICGALEARGMARAGGGGWNASRERSFVGSRSVSRHARCKKWQAAAEEPRRVSVLPTPSQHSLFRVAKRSAATVFYSSSNEALLARPRNTIKPLLHSSSPLRLTAETDD